MTAPLAGALRTSLILPPAAAASMVASTGAGMFFRGTNSPAGFRCSLANAEKAKPSRKVRVRKNFADMAIEHRMEHEVAGGAGRARCRFETTDYLGSRE